MAKDKTIPLGFEIGTGEPIAIPLRHMAVTGQTQQSGKTTTLEALIDRSEGTALTFLTKRGEGAFAAGRRVQPYFRDRADWQFVTALIDATLQEKNKFLRSWIIRTCQTTETLAEVQELIREAMKKARGADLGAYIQIDAYLQLIVPEIKRAKLAASLDLRAGLNVMDVIGFTTPMQMLFIQSALDWVNDHCEKTTVVIPEAWEFIPQSKSSPVKSSAETLIRKGAGLGNHIWLDSQDMAGVDNLALRACTVWLIGVQREANELKRALDNIPKNLKRPNAGDVATLERGQFFACFGKTVVRVYVQPAWMTVDQARAIALGNADVDDAPAPAKPARPPKEDEVDAATARALTEENERLKGELAAAEQRGFQKGVSSGLRQAGEFWAAAALDMRDNALKVADLGEHLAGLARDGNWALPAGGAAKPPLADKPAADRQPKPTGDVEAPGPAAMAMLDVLVASYPQELQPHEWALFSGKSPDSAKAGPWYKNLGALRGMGFIEQNGKAFRATEKGIRGSGRKPAEPKNAAELWGLWRDPILKEIGGASSYLLVLAEHRSHRLTAEQWALLCGKSPITIKAGPWYAMIRTLRDWELIDGDGAFRITAKGLALIPDLGKPAKDTAEQLRLARVSRLEKAKRHYDALTKPLSRQQLAQALGIGANGMKAGPWYGAIKEMLESGLVAEDGGNLYRKQEELAGA